jgi:hypothetical protein
MSKLRLSNSAQGRHRLRRGLVGRFRFALAVSRKSGVDGWGRLRVQPDRRHVLDARPCASRRSRRDAADGGTGSTIASSQTPSTYFAHHLGMHHAEENLAGDLSTTIHFSATTSRTGPVLGALCIDRAGRAGFLPGSHAQTPLDEPNDRGRDGVLDRVRKAVLVQLDPTLVAFGVPIVAIRMLMMFHRSRSAREPVRGEHHLHQ